MGHPRGSVGTSMQVERRSHTHKYTNMPVTTYVTKPDGTRWVETTKVPRCRCGDTQSPIMVNRTQLFGDGEHRKTGDAAKDARLYARVRDKGVCRFCGVKADTVITIQHINKGGTWSNDNVASACTDCDMAGRRRSCKTFSEKRTTIRRMRGLDA